MIISASRRTDIPAFYTEWFIRRLREGFVLVRNPMNFHQVSRIALTSDAIECIVFWTKNPQPMLARLKEIDDLGYRYYFLFTLTPYDSGIEANVPISVERIATFCALADRIGKEKVIWRYDPIIFTNHYSTDWHITAFSLLAEKLADCTEKCIVSFVEMYKKCAQNMKELTLEHPPNEHRIRLLNTLQVISATHGITLQTCAVASNRTNHRITTGKCIDDRLLSRISGVEIRGEKDKNQRSECNCIESIDIGAYNSCPHGCLYCYANNNQVQVARGFASHNPEAHLLNGSIESDDKITERLVKKLTRKQFQLFQ